MQPRVLVKVTTSSEGCPEPLPPSPDPSPIIKHQGVSAVSRGGRAGDLGGHGVGVQAAGGLPRDHLDGAVELGRGGPPAPWITEAKSLFYLEFIYRR